jgi:PST family polysaccharide transporter
LGSPNEDAELGVLGPVSIDQLDNRVQRGMKVSLSISWIERAWIFALGVAVARGLTESDFAAYGAALAFVGVLITADDLGVLAGVINHPADIRRLAPTGVTVALTSGTALFIGLLFCAPWIARTLGVPSDVAVFQVMGIGVLADAASIVPNGAIMRDINQHRRAIVTIARLVVRTAVTVAVLLTTKGPLGIAWAYAASEVAALTVTWLVSPIRPLPGFDWNIAKALLKIGLPVTAGAMFTIGTFNIDNFIVGHQLGATELAYYIVAFNAASWLVNILGGAINQVANPAFAEYRRQQRGLGMLMSRSLVWLLEAALPCAALLIALADPLVRLLYGDRYAPAVVVVQIISALGIARLVVNLGRDGMVAEGMGRQYAAVQVLWFVLVGILVWFGAEADGLTGAAWGHLGAAAVVTALMLGVLHRRMGVHASFLRGALRPAIGAGICGGAAWLLSEALQAAGLPPIVQFLAGGAIGAITYLVVGLSFERRRAVLSPVRRRLARRRARQCTAHGGEPPNVSPAETSTPG